MMPRSLLLVLALAALAAPSPAPAGPAEAASADTTDVYETRRNHLLALPKYAWNALVHPIGRFTIWVEHEQVPARVLDLFTNEAETFGVFPYGALGGETGTAGGFTTFHSDLFGRGKGFSAKPDREPGQLQRGPPCTTTRASAGAPGTGTPPSKR